MLEPLIVLTVLNCIFMFSSTVTTCALWWQYQGHRCCPKKTATQQTFDLKRSKISAKKPEKSGGYADVNAVSKSGTNGSHKNQRHQKKRSKKSLKYLAEYQKRSGEKISSPNTQEAKKFDEKTKMSEASQTINDTKSTVVMEFSTVQKVVQIVDNDPDINLVRAPFKELVIQKDTADKKRDYNVEQNFEANIAAAERLS